MYNVRSKQQSVKNKKSQDIHSFKSCKLNCSCSANSKFKRNQSDNRFNAKSDPWIQTNKDSDRLLRDELKRYGLDARKVIDSKCKQSCPGHEKCCINVKNSPHICLMQREHHDQQKLKSKTDSNLTFESYVVELKNEIKAQREDIPSIPKKYKQKYLNSIKEELLLNKVASEHEDSKKVKELIREIQVYRASKGAPFMDAMKPATAKSNNVQGGECKDPERCRKNNCKASSECGSVKGGKGRKIKKRSSNRHKLQGRNEPSSSSKVQDPCSPIQEQQPTRIITDEATEKPNTDVEVDKLEVTSVDAAQSEPDAAKEPDVEKEPDKTEDPIVDTEPETAKEDSRNRIEPNLIKRLDIIDELIPKLSSVIETSEKNLKKTFEEVFQAIKVVQERGVSPIEELVKLIPVEDENLEKRDMSTILREQSSQSQSTYEEAAEKKDKKKLSKTTFKEHSEKPLIGDLLVNIENIRESKCLLEGFQKELSQIKRDISECIECEFHQKPDENSISLDEKYCDKHGIYIPLIKMKYVCPKSDQIRIFNALKTEISLKKELENQLQKISKLERELSKVKISQNQEEIKTIEAALQFTKSYFKNLLVKQETERLLNEQQKILKQDSTHRCHNTKKCDKCCVETQIQEILSKVRESINKDLIEAHQRLKIQKMPDINIKKPLQIQQTLRLNIPPTASPPECVRNNVACETVFAGDKNNKTFTDREVQTRILISKTTSIESHPETKSPKNGKNDKGPKEKSPRKEEVRILKFLDKSSYCMELTEKKKRNGNGACNPPKTEKCIPNDPYCCQIQKAREAMRESIFEISHKTPSELGFRCTVGTQCDSETSFSEPRITPTVRLMETRGVGLENSSNYLFGFKEYLRDKSVDCSSVRRGSNKVDVVLQVNLERSFDSDLDSMAKSTQSEYNKPLWPPTIPRRISVHHDKDEEVSKSITITDSALAEETTMYSNSKRRLDSRIRSIPRIPSLKKMFFPPEDGEEVLVAAKTMSSNLQTELTEVKSKTKRVSNTQEETLDLEIETGDVFYKSLIGTTNLPERKTIISLDNHLKINASSSSRETLRTLSTEGYEEDGQSLVHPVILEQMTENQNAEDVQSIDGEYIEDEIEAITPQESNEKRADENLSIDHDLTVGNQELEYRDDHPMYMSHSEVDTEIPKDMSLPSSQADKEVSDGTKFSYSNYLPSEDIPYESPVELRFENIDNEMISKENTQMLESIVSKIMDNAKDKITEQLEIVQQEPENEEEKLGRDFNISDFDYSHLSTNKSTEKQSHAESTKETVLSLFSPNYTLSLNKTNKDHKGNILEADFLPNLPIFLKSNKTFENYKSFHDSLQLSDDTSHTVEKPSQTTEHLKKHETKTLHYINHVISDQYDRNEEPCKIDCFDFPQRHIERKTLDNSNPKNRLAGLKKIAEERLEYAKKCSKEERSFDSSILSSEGEVKCKCPHVSVGEYHHCPYQKRVRLKNPHPSIQYKNKLSSHIVLENERKHYNHWVTYYSNKKEEECSTSNSIGTKGTKD